MVYYLLSICCLSQIRVRHVNHQHDALRRGLGIKGHPVLERVVEDDGLALAPRARLAGDGDLTAAVRREREHEATRQGGHRHT